jgi:hypothetical protein
LRRLIAAPVIAFSFAVLAGPSTAASMKPLSFDGVATASLKSHHGTRWNLLSHGKIVGRATFRCRQVSHICFGTFHLRRGTLSAKILDVPVGRREYGSITGGSGVYRGARGGLTVRSLTAKRVRFILALK